MRNNQLMVNLGCGTHYHADWLNINFTKTGDNVLVHDLTKGIPLDAGSADIVYHSHVIEHFNEGDGLSFIKECARVLKSKGIIRIATPDLLRLTKEYITISDSREMNDNLILKKKHQWLLIEMYDQVLRTNSGGKMVEFLQEMSDSEVERFVLSRCGYEIEQLLGIIRSENIVGDNKKISIKDRIAFRIKNFRRLFKESLISKVLGNEYALLQEARFRKTGEVHYCMYDFSRLKDVLSKCGFTSITQESFNTSLIPEWSSYKLDEINGQVRKPDSMFIEAVKL
jgi:predicted SAM-dependent methyltransferase